MEKQKCDNCSASMILTRNPFGQEIWRCEYCGNTVTIRPKTTSDRIFAFANRVITAMKDNNSSGDDEEDEYEYETKGMSPEMAARYKERMRAIKAKEQQAYDKRMEKRLDAYEKRINRLLKK